MEAALHWGPYIPNAQLGSPISPLNGTDPGAAPLSQTGMSSIRGLLRPLWCGAKARS